MNGNISVMPVLGIDVGGTKTVCMLADDASASSPKAVKKARTCKGAGELALEKVLHSVMEQTLEGTGIVPSAICLGIAGVDRASDEAVVRSIMSRIGYKARDPGRKRRVHRAAGRRRRCRRHRHRVWNGLDRVRTQRRGEARAAGGWGYVLGDEGSGYWIGRLRCARSFGTPTAEAAQRA